MAERNTQVNMNLSVSLIKASINVSLIGRGKVQQRKHTHPPTHKHTHTHPPTHTHKHIHTRTHIHTHTHTEFTKSQILKLESLFLLRIFYVGRELGATKLNEEER